MRVLVWGALGVVFGDIGTSPLYAMPETVGVTSYGEGLHGATVTYGSMETPDIPKIIGSMNAQGIKVDANDVSYFLGRESIVFTGKSAMSLPRKVFFKMMSQNAVGASAFFKLPPGRVVEIGMQVEI